MSTMRASPVPFRSLAATAGAGLALLLDLACLGGSQGNSLPLASPPIRIQPDSPTLFPGQTLRFTTTGGTAGAILWSVTPATGGSFLADGSFTAATPGSFTITAQLTPQVMPPGTTVLTILPAPALAGASSDGIAALGANQTAPGTAIGNYFLIGESSQSGFSTNAAGTISVRHGFTPPIPPGN